MELHFTQKTAARPVITAPEVPPERVATLRKRSPRLRTTRFLADVEKSKIEFDFVPGEEIDKIVAQIVSTPAESPTLRQGICGGPK